MADRDIARLSGSPAESLSLAAGKTRIDDPPAEFGVIGADKVLAGCARAEHPERTAPGHVPRRPRDLADLDDGEVDDCDNPDLFTSPVGGGG